MIWVPLIVGIVYLTVMATFLLCGSIEHKKDLQNKKDKERDGLI